MPEFLAPGVYVEEIVSAARPIEGVRTSTAGFIGATLAGPADLSVGPITSLAEFEGKFGGAGILTYEGEPPVPFYLWHAVRAFFLEGGKRLYVARVRHEKGGKRDARPVPEDYIRALSALEKIDEVSIIAAPGHSAVGIAADAQAISEALAASADSRSDRIAILDTPKGLNIGGVRAWRAPFTSSFAAVYYPWIRAADADRGEILLPPSGFIAGIYGRTDAARGVQKAAAGEALRTARGLEAAIDLVEQDVLNPENINAIREFPTRGIVVWGNRTLSNDPEWKYVNLRRYFIYLERSIVGGLQWVVFEPNGEPLWEKIRRLISDFLIGEWRQGALMGLKSAEAFFIKCDRTTMNQNDLDNGRLVCQIGVAPVKPAEFVLIKIGLWTKDSDP